MAPSLSIVERYIAATVFRDSMDAFGVIEMDGSVVVTGCEAEIHVLRAGFHYGSLDRNELCSMYAVIMRIHGMGHGGLGEADKGEAG